MPKPSIAQRLLAIADSISADAHDGNGLSATVITGMEDDVALLRGLASGAFLMPRCAFLPAWIFEDKQIGQHFMLAVEPNGDVHVDGGHGDPADVAQARALYSKIARIRPPEGTRYLMLTVAAVPDVGTPINEAAVATINAIAP